jgi:phosphohistidine phosphatase SixA
MFKLGVMMTDIYLVRHGEYDYTEGEREQRLTDRGVVQAELARDMLLSAGLIGNAVLLTSAEPRAAQTAEIIGKGLNLKPESSAKLTSLGVRSVASGTKLGDVIGQCFESLELEQPPQVPIIAVTHAPLINDVLISANAGRAYHGGVYRAKDTTVVGRIVPKDQSIPIEVKHQQAPSVIFPERPKPYSRKDKIARLASITGSAILAYMMWREIKQPSSERE